VQHPRERAAVQFALRWAPLTGGYRRAAWFWQPLLLLRRFAFVLVAVLVVSPAVRFTLFSLLSFVSLLGHLAAEPFSAAQLNRLESGSYVVLVLISMLLAAVQPPFPLVVQVALLLLVLVPALLMLVLTGRAPLRMACRVVRGWLRGHKPRRASCSKSSDPATRQPPTTARTDRTPAPRPSRTAPSSSVASASTHPRTTNSSEESGAIDPDPRTVVHRPSVSKLRHAASQNEQLQGSLSRTSSSLSYQPLVLDPLQQPVVPATIELPASQSMAQINDASVSNAAASVALEMSFANSSTNRLRDSLGLSHTFHASRGSSFFTPPPSQSHNLIDDELSHASL
jgi:hypothetical protein